MSKTLWIAWRELMGYFITPVGYVVIALFLVISGILFATQVLIAGEAASMRPFFEVSVFLVLFIAPAISMRLLADEVRAGTLESLLTCPIDDWQVVWGKWLAALGFFTAMLVPTFLYVLVLEVYSTPDYGPIFCGYFGLVLLGGVYLAAGVVASAIWSSQIIAYLAALFFWILFWAATRILPMTLDVSAQMADALFWMNVNQRYSDDFAKGVLDTSSVIYFLTGVVMFLVIATKVLESRRWR